MNKPSKYIFAFTASALRLNEVVKVAQYANEHGISDLKEVKGVGVVLSSLKGGTGERQFSEIRTRLEELTQEQTEVLIHGDLISQKQIALLAVCKRYHFIRDFIIEVLREKILVFDYQINESDFNSFIQNKQATHPELEKLKDSTFKKAKQVMFTILEQSGIIDSAADKRIQPQLLSPMVVKAIAEDDRNLLKIFLLPDRDINELTY